MELDKSKYEEQLKFLRELCNDNPSGAATEFARLAFDPNKQLAYKNDCRRQDIERSKKFMREWKIRTKVKKPTQMKLKTIIIHNFVSGSAFLLEYKYMIILTVLTIVTVIRTI